MPIIIPLIISILVNAAIAIGFTFGMLDLFEPWLAWIFNALSYIILFGGAWILWAWWVERYYPEWG